MKYTQLGILQIDDDIVRNYPDLVARVFAELRFVPVRAEISFRTKLH